MIGLCECVGVHVRATLSLSVFCYPYIESTDLSKNTGVLHAPPLNTPTVSLETDRIRHIQLLLSEPSGEVLCVCVRACGGKGTNVSWNPSVLLMRRPAAMPLERRTVCQL